MTSAPHLMSAGHQLCQQFSSKLPKKKKNLMLESPQKGWHITQQPQARLYNGYWLTSQGANTYYFEKLFPNLEHSEHETREEHTRWTCWSINKMIPCEKTTTHTINDENEKCRSACEERRTFAILSRRLLQCHAQLISIRQIHCRIILRSTSDETFDIHGLQVRC